MQPLATDFLFGGNDILSFRFFWKLLLQPEGGQYFLKNLISARGNCFFFIFFQILTRMEVAFRFSEIKFFKESFWLVETDFRLITNLVLLSRACFLPVDTMLEISCNQFSSIFSVPNSGSSFYG